MSPLTLSGREITPHKASVHPIMDTRNVLTNSPWTFAALWLKRNNKAKALFYWEQAQKFYEASVGLPPQSAPLLLYYCFMNAAKALLVSEGISFVEHHGVKSATPPGRRKVSVASEAVSISQTGVLPSLASFFGESETDKTHTLKDLLYNMVFIHRTYCLTYKNQKEMFVPLSQCEFVFNGGKVFLVGRVSKNVLLRDALSRLPSTFVHDPNLGPRAVRSAQSATWARSDKASATELKALAGLNKSVREDFHYINGSQALWYLKAKTRGAKRINRRSATLTLAAMHRLSEICRYRPLELASYLDGQSNWLLSEFIQMSAAQFIDEIASEITGHQFFIPNIRVAT